MERTSELLYSEGEEAMTRVFSRSDIPLLVEYAALLFLIIAGLIAVYGAPVSADYVITSTVNQTNSTQVNLSSYNITNATSMQVQVKFATSRNMSSTLYGINLSGLVLAFNCEELSGDIIDYSANSANGTPVGITYGLPGKIGTACGLNGSSYITFGTAEKFNLSTGMSAIFKLNRSAYGDMAIFSKDRDCCDSPGLGGYSDYIISNKTRAQIWRNDTLTSAAIAGNINIDLNQYYDLGMRFNRTNVSNFHNGGLTNISSAFSNVSIDIQKGSRNLRVGAMGSSSLYFRWIGSYSLGVIYNRSLDDEEFKQFFLTRPTMLRAVHNGGTYSAYVNSSPGDVSMNITVPLSVSNPQNITIDTPPSALIDGIPVYEQNRTAEFSYVVYISTAETGSLSGYVFDEVAAPLANARVQLLGGGSTNLTGPDGHYSFPNIVISGNTTVNAQKPGYLNDTWTWTYNDTTSAYTHNFTLVWRTYTTSFEELIGVVLLSAVTSAGIVISWLKRKLKKKGFE